MWVRSQRSFEKFLSSFPNENIYDKNKKQTDYQFQINDIPYKLNYQFAFIYCAGQSNLMDYLNPLNDFTLDPSINRLAKQSYYRSPRKLCNLPVSIPIRTDEPPNLWLLDPTMLRIDLIPQRFLHSLTPFML